MTKIFAALLNDFKVYFILKQSIIYQRIKAINSPTFSHYLSHWVSREKENWNVSEFFLHVLPAKKYYIHILYIFFRSSFMKCVIYYQCLVPPSEILYNCQCWIYLRFGYRKPDFKTCKKLWLASGHGRYRAWHWSVVGC